MPVILLLGLLITVPGFAGNGSGMLTLRPASYSFDNALRSSEGFTLESKIRLSDFEEDTEILSIPGILSVRLRHHDPKDIRRQNYPAGKMPDGSVPVLEASIWLCLPENSTMVREGQQRKQEMTIGVPLALLEKAWGKHDLLLNFTGVTWDMYIDGRLVDRDFTLGTPEELPDNPKEVRDERYVLSAIVSRPAMVARPLNEKHPRQVSVQYFTPQGHNAWVGDVATIWNKGRYHVFYLLDRRGHESKFGRGGHYFEHLSTTDFIHWEEHEAATPIEEQWETFGTGTPFVWNDSLYLSYGMHTSRLFPASYTSTPKQWEYIERNGESGSFSFDEIRNHGKTIPSGASYSVSTDGVAGFKKSHTLIHPAENPTIYTDEAGRLFMLANYGARGLWTSNRLDGGWTCLSEDFPPGGDCTFFFNCGEYNYIIGGFTHMWMKRKDEPIEAYKDMTAQGLDLYDGLSVPSICEVNHGRILMAGWVEVNRHWGGLLVIRELVPLEDGRIGSRFMPELMPKAKGRPRQLTGKQIKTLDNHPVNWMRSGENYRLTFDIRPTENGLLKLKFSSGDKENECLWTLDLSEKTARFGEGKSLRHGGQPHHAVDYAIENLTAIGRPFTVDVLVRSDSKLGGTLIDVEIAGQRTMISHRSGLSVSDLYVESQDLEVARLVVQKTE